MSDNFAAVKGPAQAGGSLGRWPETRWLDSLMVRSYHAAKADAMSDKFPNTAADEG